MKNDSWLRYVCPSVFRHGTTHLLFIGVLSTSGLEVLLKLAKYFKFVENMTNRIQYNTVQYSTIKYNTVQYDTTQYSTVQYNTTLYITVQYSTILYTKTAHTDLHIRCSDSTIKRTVIGCTSVAGTEVCSVVCVSLSGWNVERR